MYTNIKSTKLTIAVTYIFCILLFFMMIFAAPFISLHIGIGLRFYATLIAFYISCPAAWIALICILKLLKNILKDNIFSKSSVKLLRLLSWCCVFVSFISFVTMFFSRAFFIFFLGAGLMTLILRVLKNVMARAIEIKEENELTI